MTTVRPSIPTKLPAQADDMAKLRRQLAALTEAMQTPEPDPEPEPEAGE